MLANALLLALAFPTPYDAILNAPELSGAIVSAVVAKADGTILYERNGSLRVMPASNQKLLTTAFAMHRLGPGFVPKTRFWREPDRIVIDAPGNPTLTSKDFFTIREKLTNQLFLTSRSPDRFPRTVSSPLMGEAVSAANWERVTNAEASRTLETGPKTGRRQFLPAISPADTNPQTLTPELLPIFARQAYRPLFGPNWEFGDLPEYYAAAVTALTLDKGVFKVWASKGEVEPLPHYADVRLHVYPTAKLSLEYSPFQKLLTVRGPLPQDRTEIGTFALPAPDRAAARILGGPLFFTEQLPRRSPDHVHAGRPLKEIVAECLTISDNLYAENLLLMAATAGKPPQDNPYPAAQQELKRFLIETVGWDANDVRPDDGSGMSRHNALTARGIVRLLAWAQGQAWFEDWRGGLAVPGKGTLRSRLSGSSFQGKTGTLDMASALSGYVTNKDGERLIVSVIFNHYACPSAKAREIADNLVKAAEESSKSGTNYAYIH